MVETVPALLGAGARFLLAGAVMLAFLTIRRGWDAVRLTRRQLGAAALVGLLLPGANAVVTVAEKEVPSGLAALLIASVPLWVILLRRSAGEAVPRASVLAVLVGFLGVALLLRPGEHAGGAGLLGLAACVGAAVMWASGSFAAARVPLPRDPLVATGWEMLLGGIACALAGVLAGEAGDIHPGAWSADSVLALAYLIVVGSLLAFTVYAWLLQNVALSKVATYAYVNPVVAIVLGFLVLGEAITATTVVAAAVIVCSVALVVRAEAGTSRASGRT
jgi:drug/metabolite transporter (DMT)-like permease